MGQAELIDGSAKAKQEAKEVVEWGGAWKCIQGRGCQDSWLVTHVACVVEM